MKLNDLPRDALTPPVPLPQSPVHGVVVGKLLALTDNGQTALVSFVGQPGHAALRARSVVDLHAPHMGQDVVLMFDQGDVSRPIVMGVVRGQTGWPLQDQPATVEVDADGERMIVSAKEQLVLRCGKASLTLRSDGRIELKGDSVLTQAAGVNRVRGGSIQLN
ncbi:MAG: DUF6484 domain-containing protein [Aquabacterium sp.]|nr:DUF6484 domain-containing protein [Aquabacterium sp.]